MRTEAASTVIDLKELLKSNYKIWQGILFLLGVLLVMYGGKMIDYSFEYRTRMDILKEEKKANLEMIEVRKKADSLERIMMEQQRIKEAEHALNARVGTEEIVDRLAIELKALRAHVIKLHNHEALQNGEIIEMSVYAEGVYDSKTKEMRQEWIRVIPPPGYIKHFSFMVPDTDQYVSEYDRFRYVPDIYLDSAALANPVTSGMLSEFNVRSKVSFWVATTKRAEIFFLTVDFDFVDPAAERPDLVPKVREAARKIRLLLTGL